MSQTRTAGPHLCDPASPSAAGGLQPDQGPRFPGGHSGDDVATGYPTGEAERHLSPAEGRLVVSGSP